MPSERTFSIRPIRRLLMEIGREHKGLWLDPFCNESRLPFVKVRNDLNPTIEADYHLHAVEFLKMYGINTVDGVLFDPPYSARQVKECYGNIGRHVSQEDTQAKFWKDCKREMARIIKPGGIAVCFGWNSNGIGAHGGFELERLLIVAHGAMHNDTLVTVERKTSFV